LIENCRFAGTKWAVFEPSDEPLGAFTDDLDRQGALGYPGSLRCRSTAPAPMRWRSGR
jgi:hypothetical protein